MILSLMNLRDNNDVHCKFFSPYTKGRPWQVLPSSGSLGGSLRKKIVNCKYVFRMYIYWLYVILVEYWLSLNYQQTLYMLFLKLSM